MTTNPVHDWNQKNIEEFRANQGKVGGQFEGAPMLLLHHKGRKSGQQRVNPLVYHTDGDRYLIFGSMGGSSEHPQWYRNIKANPDVSLEVGTEQFDATAEEVTGPDRDRLYEENAKLRPAFADYQNRTTRKIPVIALKRK
jgi:deazaflavin-dependent oxidoreductase (nitroreductase family)